ncbi:MAG: cytidylate kinase-like family protein [Lachnospiraceae bacterium]|nr:cytidylate kinase-like family protein [Lachnospiraceae bacterium]
MNRIITIGREFGSGGRELGLRLSQRLGIAYYDQEIISEISRRTELSEQYVRKMAEKKPMFSFPLHIGRSFHYMQNSPWDLNLSIFREQSAIIREMAEKSDCVIVGRCADDILREMNPLRIFVYGDMETKLERCRKRTGSDEKMTDREILSNIRKIDKNRSEYYGLYTGKVWGDKQSYDLCINTSKISVERASELLAEFVR